MEGKTPEGFFNAGTLADANGKIDGYACQNHSSITRLWIPNTITAIGSNAFAGCSSLVEIVFQNDGNLPLDIGLMAFARCIALPSVSLPGRVVNLGAGCFRDCTSLVRLTITQGNKPLEISGHLFDNCPGKDEMLRIVTEERNRRAPLMPAKAVMPKRKKKTKFNTLLQGLRLKMPGLSLDNDYVRPRLKSVYELMKSDGDFTFATYCEGYKEACLWFLQVADWADATEDELHQIVCGSWVRKVANLDRGEIDPEEYENADKRKVREICGAIRRLIGSDDEFNEVFKQEGCFIEQFLAKGTRHPAAFYRMVAAIRPELVVPVPAIAKLLPVYDWLTGEDSLNSFSANWYKLSRIVRLRLQGLMLGETIYQVGVFAWYLAEAFRDDLKKDSQAMGRKMKVLSWLKEVGLLDG